ncbi:hypothetical protein BCR34DRAFT_444579, partial [Clohesyomyces aquaticus]
TTLYPKITTHLKEVLKTLHHQPFDPSDPTKITPLPPSIPLLGTTKLHGTHADILVHPDNSVTLQSRNNPVLLTTADNHGFAAFMSAKTLPILQLQDRYVQRWKDLNPGKMLDETVPLTIAGEWIGSNIQNGIALAQLSKRFVIISVKINNCWVLDSDFADIEDPDQGIYNISRGGFYHATLYPCEADQSRTITALEDLAEKIAARCPFAESFGVVGEGEGIVWKMVPWAEKEELWFKTKGGRFKPTYAPAPKQPATSDEKAKREQAEQVARVWCGEQRLEQGWDYLRERGIERNMKGIGQFLKWAQMDVLVEERGYIEEFGVDEKMLRGEITGLAKMWFL